MCLPELHRALTHQALQWEQRQAAAAQELRGLRADLGRLRDENAALQEQLRAALATQESSQQQHAVEVRCAARTVSRPSSVSFGTNLH